MKSFKVDTRTHPTGSQEPRIRVCPDYEITYGADAARLAEVYAYPLDEWQRNVLNDWLARDEYGKPVCITCGLLMPRQNGKNFCIEIFELFCATVLGWHVLHTAHRVNTARKAFARLAEYFEGPRSKPELRKMARLVRHANGQEAIELTNGGMVEFATRSNQGGRGFDDIQVLVIDEAQGCTAEHMEAMLSVLSASSTGSRQTIWTGTPPDPTLAGTEFRKTREQAISGELRKSCWYEWSVERPPEVGLKYEDVLPDLYATNPAMGTRLDEDFAAVEYAKLTPDGFARERLGWWLTLEESSLFAKSDMEATALDKDEAAALLEGDVKTSLGVKFATDGSCASIALVAKKAGSPYYMQLLEVGTGRESIDWLADKIEGMKEKASCVVIDGMYGRDVLINELIRNKRFPKKGIIAPKSNDVATAATMFKSNLETHNLNWFSEQDRLLNSVLTAERRKIGDRGAWGIGGEDSTPVEAVSLALFGLMTTKRKAGRKLRVG